MYCTHMTYLLVEVSFQVILVDAMHNPRTPLDLTLETLEPLKEMDFSFLQWGSGIGAFRKVSKSIWQFI